MAKIIGICSLYEPLQFLSNRIRNLNQCNLTDTLIYFADCSSEPTRKEVKRIIESECKFQYRLHQFDKRTTLYYTWDWIIMNVLSDPDLKSVSYFHNINVDDIQHPEYHQKMSKFLDDNPQIQIVACPWLITNKQGQIWPPEHDNCSGPDINRTMGHFPMWRASIHPAIRFDGRMVAVGDSYFWTWVKRKYGIKSFAILNEQLSCYLSHQNNLYYTAKGPQGQGGEGWDRSIGDKM